MKLVKQDGLSFTKKSNIILSVMKKKFLFYTFTRCFMAVAIFETQRSGCSGHQISVKLSSFERQMWEILIFGSQKIQFFCLISEIHLFVQSQFFTTQFLAGILGKTKTEKWKMLTLENSPISECLTHFLVPKMLLTM